MSALRSPPSRGFTLLEILVVIVILAAIVAMATLSVNVAGRDSELQQQTERLAAILRQAQEETELQGRETGVWVDRTGYEFQRYDGATQTWQPIGNDDLYAARRLPEGLSLRLWMEGREVVLKPQDADAAPLSADNKEKTDAQRPPPQILLLSSGEINAFELRIERDNVGHAWRIASQLDNTLIAEELDHAL